MIIREIKGYEYEVHIGESVVKEVLKDELSGEAVDFIARIEETANDLIGSMYTRGDVLKEVSDFARNMLMTIYNKVKTNKDLDVLKYLDETFALYKEYEVEE